MNSDNGNPIRSITKKVIGKYIRYPRNSKTPSDRINIEFAIKLHMVRDNSLLRGLLNSFKISLPIIRDYQFFT
ncbi:hypothetical protein KH172YL63_21990 [Bacillus sp. KH172YL63]|nr:hypothetical protein KH172YL63_21990 [Bacillus sp. KH172YL63]